MNRATRAQQLVNSCWYGRSWLSVVLLPLAWLFSGFVSLRRAAYAGGLFGTRRADLPVIVVGNITAGGTGKTPVAAWLAGQLQQRGYRPAIVSRGYGGKPSAQPVLVSAASDAAVCGDEPVLLARVTGCPVVVCTDRVAAVGLAKRQGAGVAIADDGLQHYGLYRDVEIAVVDGARMFGNGRCLPAGPLREPVRRLQSVDAVLVNGAAAEFGRRFDLHIEHALRLDGSETVRLSDFAGREVWGVAGIANPARFFSALRACGIEVREVPLADHGRVDLAGLINETALPVLMTEKDAVKYSSDSINTGVEVWYVPAVLAIEDADKDAVMGMLLEKLPRVSG